MKDLNPKYDPKSIEEKLYKFWEDNNFFKANENSTKKPYTIVIPPPNVTGNLHMGHALVDTIQDILIRYKRMQGYEALWIPGTDHAGIATQSVVEKHLIAKFKKRRKDFTREEFLKHVWQWKEEKESNILNQLRKLGCSLDWSRQRFTMDEKSNFAVRKVFKKMFDDGLIYRGDYLVNWDPITQTALADDEVEYEEKDSFLWHFKYPIKDSKKFITIATTRPETMLGDTAIAVSPKDERYQKYIGRSCILPIINREIPIIEDRYVDPSFGSGAVKITPAHDSNDYEIGIRHSLPMINIMTPDGRINENGKEFFGLSMQKARDAVVDKMKQLNLLEKVEPYKLRVGISYRSKATIQPYLSKQWFVKMTPFKNKLMSAVKENRVKIIPKNFEDTYFHWIKNLRDWCISRQLWWGHRIPVWYNKEDMDVMLCSDDETPPKEVLENPDKWVQDEDVLDTWFSSALWPFSTLGWPDNTKELKKFYPTSILVTGHDILFFWVARMILMGEYVMNDVPFHETFIHGLIYGKSYWREEKDGSITYVSIEEKNRYDLGEKVPKDVFSKWEKMSKSKGNVIDPIEIINEYGTDAMRIALTSSCTHARQIDLDRRKFDEYKNFSNKIWNAFRFIFLNLFENKDKNLSALSIKDIEEGLNLKSLTLDDKWILFKLNETINNEINYLENKSFDKAATIIYDFFWNDFCAYYIELVKPYLFGNLGDEKFRKNKQKVLLYTLLSSIRLMHPIAPFITEEIFSKIKELYPLLKIDDKLDPFTLDFIEAMNRDALIVSTYPKPLKNNIFDNVDDDFNFLKDCIHSIRNIRAEMQIAPHIKTKLYVYTTKNSKNLNLLKENETFLYTLAKVKEIIYITDEKDMTSLRSNAILKDLKLIIPLPKELIEKEKNRLNKEKIKLEKQNEVFSSKINDNSFLEKAPKEVVSKMKMNFEENQKKLKEIDIKMRTF
ncbi:MAG: Valine--tRNA ligase [Candidatus Anoxychlamydiales bacterium]|nr:Valine--tRNA ligase [Candidatus Anoxychlamydiales bacterium]